MINEEINIPAGLLKYERRMKGQYRGIRQWIDRLVREDKIQEIYNSNQWDKMSKVILKAYDGGYTEKDAILALDRLQTIEITRIKKYGTMGIQPWEKWLKDGETEKTKAEQDWLRNEFSEYFDI